MNTLKKAILLLAVSLTAAASAYLVEHHYRRLVQQLFKDGQGDHIQFYGLDLPPTTSPYIVVGFAVFAAVLTALLWQLPRLKACGYLALTIGLFFLANLLTTSLDSLGKVAACTACRNGIRPLRYNDIDYDAHFIMGLVAAILPVLVVVVRQQYRRSH